MKTCPRCGFTGEISHCPNDGEVLLGAPELSERDGAEATLAPAPGDRQEHPDVGVAATLAEVDVSGQQGHAELFRDENFGKWAEPEVKKKAGDPMLGRTIGKYEVISLLGQGGMGAVYKARQVSVKRDIALKVLLREFADNEVVVKRFYHEALAASRLKHPNTITVYDYGQSDDGVLYIAMEYLRGESLAHALHRAGAMTPKRVVHIMRQCCKSLAEAHKAGIIHRDLKPDNIFLTDIEGERDFAKVLDFGVAKLKEYEGKEGTLTQAGMIFGTPKYMSPEQARSGALDARSDVYALGVILYEMLMGKAPFTGDNPLSILISHVNEQPRRFAQFNPSIQVPQALEAVVFRALAKDREQRQLTVEALLVELDAVDELLAGARYETLADRLPALLPGAEGTPSLVGPAILPAGHEGTAPAKALEKGGTVRLGDDGKPVLEDQSPTAQVAVGEISLTQDLAMPRKSRTGLFAGLGLLAAGGAAAAVIFLQPGGPGPGSGTDTAANAALVAGAGGPAEASASPTAAPTAPPTIAAPPSADPRAKSCLLVTDPTGVRVFETDHPETQLGVTKSSGLPIRVAGPTKYLLRLTGYKEQVIEVDPKLDPCVVQAKLKAARGPLAASKGNEPGASGVVTVPAGQAAPAPGQAPAPATRERVDISIQ